MALFDNPTEEPEEAIAQVRRSPSTSETKRYACLKTKRLGSTWYEGPASRYFYRYGPSGVTCFDTGKWR
jgi:hypothetical protein